MVTLIVPTVVLLALLQGVPQPTAMKLGKPVNDPVSAKGCLRGTMLVILESDAVDLGGVREVKLTGPRSLMKQLADYRNYYLDVVGVLTTEGGNTDRIETRRREKVGSRTTISVGAKAERSRAVAATPTTASIAVQAFEPLAAQCPGAG